MLPSLPFVLLSSTMGIVSSLNLSNPFANPRIQLSTQFVALKAKNSIGVEDVLASPKWPDEWPFTENDLRRQDETDDGIFYSVPRFVYHVDEKAVAALTEYYATEFPKLAKKEGEKPAVLDLCASHVSHFPNDVSDYTGKRVALGMNEEELKENTQVDDFVVQDLNVNPTLPFPDNSFDIVTNAVSIDYLTRPLEICKEVARVLKPGGTAMFALSNRCFPTKAIGLWLQTNGEYKLYAHICRGVVEGITQKLFSFLFKKIWNMSSLLAATFTIQECSSLHRPSRSDPTLLGLVETLRT